MAQERELILSRRETEKFRCDERDLVSCSDLERLGSDKKVEKVDMVDDRSWMAAMRKAMELDG